MSLARNALLRIFRRVASVSLIVSFFLLGL
jgi:hypothetical protein